MVALVRPGGVVTLHEAAASGFIEPPLPAWAKLEEPPMRIRLIKQPSHY